VLFDCQVNSAELLRNKPYNVDPVFSRNSVQSYMGCGHKNKGLSERLLYLPRRTTQILNRKKIVIFTLLKVWSTLQYMN